MLELLAPYVPRFHSRWLRERPQQRHQAIDCTLVFADVSGFTRMTELLGSRGKAGAEEMAELINQTFEALLEEAYCYDAGLIKWGGDAAVLLFTGDQHAVRGARAAREMQRVMDKIGSVKTSRGTVRLRMSIGIHSGTCDFFLLGSDSHLELVLTGPATTSLARMEKLAQAGQVVISAGTADALAGAGQRRPTEPIEDGFLLRYTPPGERRPFQPSESDTTGEEVALALCRALREHVLGGGVDHEHRSAAIGFIEFAGVDELLTRQGPDVTADALAHVITEIQSACERHGVAYLATDIGTDGGKVMLSAGAPRRLGADEDRMIATVQEVLERAGTLQLSGGITAGRAFAGDFGPPYRRTYSLMGDCVNLAARLTARAESSQLLANPELVAAASGGFSVTERAPFAAKGKAAPVRSLIIGPAARGDGHGRIAAAVETAMVGRETELRTLLELSEAAVSGRGAAVDLLGDPGMGKSRLLGELRSRTQAEVLWDDGDVYSGSRPYAPFERLLRTRLGLGPEDPAEEFAARLSVLVSEHAPHLQPWLPLIAVVAGLDLPETLEVTQTSATQRKARLEETTSELLSVVLSDPTVFVFNDSHLLDDASRDLIKRLGEDAATRRWLVIASRRRDTPSPLDGPTVTQIELAPLSTAAAAQLLAGATADAPLPQHRLSALAERAAGNPLFLRELVTQLAAGGDPGALPRSVEEAIGARIDRLAPSDRRTLRAAAVLGIDLDEALLAEVLGPDAQIPERLAALSDFLEPVSPGRSCFNHGLVREVAYEGLPYRRRRELHTRTAAAIEHRAGAETERYADLLATHSFQGGNHEGAWHYALIAAETARSRYANAQAGDSYELALAAAKNLPAIPAIELSRVDLELADIHVELGDFDAADQTLRRALRRERGDAVSMARIELKLARLREISSKPVPALRWVTRAEQNLAGQESEDALRIRAALTVRKARIYYRRGRYADGWAAAREGAELARRTGDLRTLAEALDYGDTCARAIGEPAGPGAEQALAIYQQLGDLGAQGRVHNTLGLLAYFRGAWPEALAHYQASGSAYERSGTRWDAATSIANAAEVLADQGKLDQAQEGLEQAMRIWRAAAAASEIAFGNYLLGRIAARRGNLEEAQQLFASARAQFQATGETYEVELVDALSAEAQLLTGHRREARELAEAMLAGAPSADLVPLLQRVRGTALGAGAEAERALRASVAAARAIEAEHEVAFALQALLAESGYGGPDERSDWQQEADRLLAQLGIVS
jgi:class 3 adenylate cyclase/tetratricopeptide (TPR) repeat protein